MEGINGVTMSDYTGFYPEELAGMSAQGDLMKALDTGGYSTTSGTGGPLIGQSLENTVHIVTFDIQRHIPLFKKIVKQPAFATIEEYNRLTSYGEGGAFFSDGGLPNEDDAVYERVVEKVKFMGCQGEVTGPMMLAGRAKFGDILAMQVYNRTAFLLRKIEEALFMSNDDNNSLAFRGIFQQIIADASSQNVIDMKGAPLELGNLEDASTIIADNYGFSDLFIGGVQVKADLSKLLYPSTRFNSPGQAAAAGIPINEYASANGTIDLMSDVWLRPGSVPLTIANKGSVAAPGAPTCTTGSLSGSILPVGVYYYKVSSVNAAGESLPVAGNAAVTITVGTGQTGNIVITNVSGALSYKIYRGTTTTNMTYLDEIKTGTSTTTYVDDGSEVPGTSKAVMMDQSQLALKQLLPIRKVDLSRVADSTRWMQIAYLTLVLYAPNRFVLFKNIGRAS